MEKATTLILFGATGDLVSRKVLPSLFSLHEKGFFKGGLTIVPFTRRNITTETYLSEWVLPALTARVPGAESGALEGFRQCFHYVRGDYATSADFVSLKSELEAVESSEAVRLYYLAVYPEQMEAINHGLSEAGVVRADDRVVIEKPFGDSLASAESLLASLVDYYLPEQLFLLDHALGKPSVRAITKFTFDNILVKTTLLPQYIDQVEIRYWETMDVAKRGAFYDPVGALVDVLHNHVLQILATTLMHEPDWRDPGAVQHARGDILAGLELMSPETVAKNTKRAQYQGYQDTAGVAIDSETETAVKISSRLTWLGRETPVVLSAGKALGTENEKLMKISFTPHGTKDFTNEIVIHFEPEESVEVRFVVPYEDGLRERRVVFPIREDHERVQYIEEYSRLLSEALLGDQTWFVSPREALYQWRFVAAIKEGWQKNGPALTHYERATPGAEVIG